MTYQRQYTARFSKNLGRFQNIRARIKKRVDEIAHAPYQNTERLGKASEGLNLKGCRSARVGRNIRILFVVCEECRKESECEYCLCENLADQTIVFLTINTHDKAYEMK